MAPAPVTVQCALPQVQFEQLRDQQLCGVLRTAVSQIRVGASWPRLQDVPVLVLVRLGSACSLLRLLNVSWLRRAIRGPACRVYASLQWPWPVMTYLSVQRLHVYVRRRRNPGVIVCGRPAEAPGWAFPPQIAPADRSWVPSGHARLRQYERHTASSGASVFA